MAFTIQKAVKAQSLLRMAIQGPSGSGKTYTALALATYIFKQVGGTGIGVIDTERGSAAKYAHLFDFDVIALEDFHPVEGYRAAMREFAKAGYKVVVVDSASHEWMGSPRGCLELHGIVERQIKNSFAAWSRVTPLHDSFIEGFMNLPAHVILTLRSKAEYVEAERQGKKTYEMVGSAPIQRTGLEYEFDVAMQMGREEHDGLIEKTRFPSLDGRRYVKPGEDLAEIIWKELTIGTPAVQHITPPPSTSVDNEIPVEGKPDPEAERRVEIELKLHCLAASGDDRAKAAKLWAERYEKLNFHQRQAALLELAPGAPVDQARENLIQQIEQAFKDLYTLGKTHEEITEQVARICNGQIGIDDMDKSTLVKLAEGIFFWRDVARAELKKAAGK